MENSVPKITLQYCRRLTRPWVFLSIIGVLLLFMNQSTFAQQRVPVPCTNPIPANLVGVDATGPTNNNAKIRLTGLPSGEYRVGYSVGDTYTGPAFAAANKFSVLQADSSYLARNLQNPTTAAGTKYIVRVFAPDTTCYYDHTFILERVNFNTKPLYTDVDVNVTHNGGTFVAMNSQVTVTIVARNTGTAAASGLEFKLEIPEGLSNVTAANVPAGTTYTNGVWTVPTLAAETGTATLTLTGTITSRGIRVVTANLTKADESNGIKDVDSKADADATTNVPGEDDYSQACISTPFDYCNDDEYKITLANYTGVVWRKGDVVITADNAASLGVIFQANGPLIIKSEGEYSYTIVKDGATNCPTGGCCPIKIEAGIPPKLATTDLGQSICYQASFADIKATLTQNPRGTVIYEWYNDNGTNNAGNAIIAGQNTDTFTAKPTEIGVYKYKLKVYDQDHKNCADSISFTITIKDLPIVAITKVPDVCEEGTISFKLDGNVDGATFAWAGPAASGFTSTIANPEKLNADKDKDAGIYTVTVTNGQSCSATATTLVVINVLPDAPKVDPKVFCEKDAEATLVAINSGAGYTTQWYENSPTGGTASLVAPNYNPVKADTLSYYVSQKNDATGCESHRAQLKITVNAKPDAPTTNPVAACKDSAPVTLAVNENTTGYTILWYDKAATGGTASTTATIAPTADIGKTTYYLSKKDNVTTCESNRSSIEVTIKEIPVLTLNPVTVCAEDTISLAVQGASPTDTYSWTGANGFASTLAGPEKLNASSSDAGLYSVTVTNGESCSASATTSVTVNELPKPPAVALKEYCPGDIPVPLTATELANHSLLWYGRSATGGDASQSYTPDPIITKTSGLIPYYVSQKDNVTGCESPRAELTVKVNRKPPTPKVEDAIYCQAVPAMPLTFKPDAGHEALWFKKESTGDIVAEAIDPTPSTAQPGTTFYYVSHKENSTGCISDRDTIKVEVNPTPGVPVITQNKNTYCEGETPTALLATAEGSNTILWIIGGGTSATPPPVHTETAGLTNYYVLQVIPGTGCESGWATIPVTVNPKPIAELIAVNALCVGSTPQSNAQLILTRYRDSDKVSFSMGTTYNPATATPFATIPDGTGGVFASTLPNPTVDQAYTVRVQNRFECTADQSKVITYKDCGCPGGYCEPATIEQKRAK